VQMPARQDSPSAHAWPHAPQFCSSELESTHELAQARGVAVGHLHSPDTHVWAALHALPHVPQFFGSFSGAGMPLHIRQSSVFPSQSLSTPSPQTSTGAFARHAQTVWAISRGAVHTQPGTAGHAAKEPQGDVQMPRPGDTSRHKSDAQSSVTLHGEPNAPEPPP